MDSSLSEFFLPVLDITSYFLTFRVGDFVVSMNDINVTNGNLKDVQAILDRKTLTLKLVLRNGSKLVENQYSINLSKREMPLRRSIEIMMVIRTNKCPEVDTRLKNGDRIEQVCLVISRGPILRIRDIFHETQQQHGVYSKIERYLRLFLRGAP